AHSRLSQGLASVTELDFLKKFYSAFEKALTEANTKCLRSSSFGAESTPSRESSSCLDTPSAPRTIRRIVNKVVAERHTETEKVIRRLGGACLTLSAKLKLAEDHEKGYLEALNSKKEKRKHEKSFTENLRA
ncbi:hypothetical protein GcC1_112019, partial [Golovinomyces cichoracearum]